MKHRLKRFIVTTVVLTQTTGCAWLTRHLTPPGPSPLVVASCPKLTPLLDPSFGATTEKLVEVAGIYYECRAAAGVP